MTLESPCRSETCLRATRPVLAVATGALAGVLVLAGSVSAQHGSHEQGVDSHHGSHQEGGGAGHQCDGETCPMHAGKSTDGSLQEPGQAVFGALREVLERLEADPATDWSRVDLDALRDHLVQMDLLFREARVSREVLDDGMRFVVDGSESVLSAAKAMGAMHARALAEELPSWLVRVEPRAGDVVFEVRSSDPAQQAKIRALGFSGLLTFGAHHAPHHWALATGGGMHQHHEH
ncbi:MAG TPA: hypothetical protein VNB06_08765 [Thermoanaerobaculia bacterium]|nr:hypothetical protein [Thermoanaerobaculia bacterium]